MSLFSNKIDFVQDELKDLPELKNLPKGKIKDFTSKIGYALSLGLKEKEIFFFGLLQWASVILAYLLWLQMLYWIPQELWDWVGECLDGPGDNDGCTLAADIPLMLWGLLCIFLAAFPLGILSSAMGTTHFLHKNGEESTVIKCLHAAFSNAWATWNFHFVDGYITVMQIAGRLPSEDNKYETAEQAAARKAASEALYYAWKIGVAGVLPSIVLGNGVIESGKNSIKFVKNNFVEVVKLRAAYSAICWVVGILAYIGGIFTIYYMGDSIYASTGGLAIAKVYLYLLFPIAIAVSAVMMFLRPIYILSLCDMYYEFLKSEGEEAHLPDDPSSGKKALITFSIICLFIGIIAGFRDELGLTNQLSIMPEEIPKQERYIKKQDIYIEYNPQVDSYDECINNSDGYQISSENLTLAEYLEKLDDYCSDKFNKKESL